MPREEIKVDPISKMNQESGELITKIQDLGIENDILKETIEILKKDQGIDLIRLKTVRKQ